MQDLRGYGGDVMPSDIVGSVLDCAKPYTTRRGLFVHGAGDHGGSGTARDIEVVCAITATPLLPRAEPSATVPFYEQALADVAGGPSPFPVVRGELNTVFEGCYTSHADIKRLESRAGERPGHGRSGCDPRQAADWGRLSAGGVGRGVAHRLLPPVP